MDLDRVWIFGHSYGGATTAEALAQDKRFKAGVSLEGSRFNLWINYEINSRHSPILTKRNIQFMYLNNLQKEVFILFDNEYDFREPQFNLIPPNVLNTQLTQGRVGHYFKSHIPGFGMVTWQLISFTPPAAGADIGSGTVSMNIINPNGSSQFTQVSNQDLVGLQYIGPSLPQPVSQPIPSWCLWYPAHPSCQRSDQPTFRGYVTYWVPVNIPLY
jgi:pimeloyl-ACP methyl ester carboxylesterase